MAKDIVQQSSLIQVSNQGDKLVVDSRLIASQLGIQHETFLRTIKKYQSEIESDWGTIRFENGSDIMPNGQINPKPEKFVYLNEQQATLLMTYSRNTDQVRLCKRSLVKSFEYAKELLKSNEVKKAPAKVLNRNYASSQKECRDQLKRHGAGRKAYQLTEQYNNQLSGVESGSRHEVTAEQANQIGCNYLFGAIELLKREKGFNDNNDYHLANTCKMGMRHGMYEQLGADSVPEKLKPKKERKQLKAQ